jgi:hypothetical protein
MSKRRLKQVAAVAFLGCVSGFVALRVAWATPPAGLNTTILTVGPMELGEIDIHSGMGAGGAGGDHQVKIKTKGISDVYVVRNIIQPGGHTGWHSHPGPSIISVVSGVATAYEGDDPVGVQIPAGTAFVDSGDHAHIIRNEGAANLELIAFQILPEGAPRRIDEDAP